MQDWNGLAKGLLKAEMAKRHMRAPDLAAALATDATATGAFGTTMWHWLCDCSCPGIC